MVFVLECRHNHHHFVTTVLLRKLLLLLLLLLLLVVGGSDGDHGVVALFILVVHGVEQVDDAVTSTSVDAVLLGGSYGYVRATENSSAGLLLDFRHEVAGCAAVNHAFDHVIAALRLVVDHVVQTAYRFHGNADDVFCKEGIAGKGVRSFSHARELHVVAVDGL